MTAGARRAGALATGETRDVLALHCMLASGAAWRCVGAALPGARLACPDLPGHGRAAPPGGVYMDAALDAVLDRASPGPFDVVGHSYGGCLALRLLAEHPACIRSLALVEPVMFAAADASLQAREVARMAPFDAALEAGECEAAAREFTAIWGDGTPWEALPDRIRTQIRARIGYVGASGPGIVSDAHAILPRLPKEPPPVLIVTRADPPAIVRGIAEGLAARLPGTRRAELGQGHMIPMEVPEALSALLTEFWAGAS